MENSEIKIDLKLQQPDDETKNKINLIIHHDESFVTTNYINLLMQKFGDYFKHVFIVSENEPAIENLQPFANLTVTSSIKPLNLGGEWILILEPGEFPSIQLLNNLSVLIESISNEVKIVRLPIVICEFKTGDIIDIIPPRPRFFRENPQLLTKSGKEEIEVKDFPLVKLYADPETIAE